MKNRLKFKRNLKFILPLCGFSVLAFVFIVIGVKNNGVSKTLSKSNQNYARNLKYGGHSQNGQPYKIQSERGTETSSKEVVFDSIKADMGLKDEESLRTLRTLETAMKYAQVSEDRVNFRISEYLTIGLSVGKKNNLFINDDEMNDETTLESLFSSPIIPIVNKNFYPILLEVSKNLDKFVELDVVKKVNNLINPYLEIFAFNFQFKTYFNPHYQL
jgi:hypothetical protein